MTTGSDSASCAVVISGSASVFSFVVKQFEDSWWGAFGDAVFWNVLLKAGTFLNLNLQGIWKIIAVCGAL
ncbi:hypothetical protein AHAS_Ahas02G0034000 [Arachis hypogaea]